MFVVFAAGARTVKMFYFARLLLLLLLLLLFRSIMISLEKSVST